MNNGECLHCGYTGQMVLLSSINKKVCPECKSYNIWNLKTGQKSVLIHGMVGDDSGSENNLQK